MESIIPNKEALRFILAGKSEFTLLSLKTGVHFSYKIIKKESNQREGNQWVYFVSVINQAEVYAGALFYNEDKNEYYFSKGKNGNYSYNEIEIKSLLFVLNSLQNGKFNMKLEIYHCGKCGRCGRRLTTPESIQTGLGTECANKIGIPHPKNKKK